MEYEYVCPKCGKLKNLKSQKLFRKRKITMKYVDIVNLN